MSEFELEVDLEGGRGRLYRPINDAHAQRPVYSTVWYFGISVTVTVTVNEDGAWVCRHYRLEAELLAEVNWRVRWDDVRFGDSASDVRKAHTVEHNGSRYGRVCTTADSLYLITTDQ